MLVLHQGAAFPMDATAHPLSNSSSFQTKITTDIIWFKMYFILNKSEQAKNWQCNDCIGCYISSSSWSRSWPWAMFGFSKKVLTIMHEGAYFSSVIVYS